VRAPISRRSFGIGAVAGMLALPFRSACAGEVPAAGSLGAHTCASDGQAFLHGSRRGKLLALSFDACPTSKDPSFAPEVVEYLEADRVPATFFVSGRWAETNPGHLEKLKQMSLCEIGLHGYRHPRLIDASAETIRAEIENGRTALRQMGARPAPLFRPPYLDQPPILSSVARQCGVRPITGDAGLGDPDPNRSADVMERDAIEWVQAGSIIIEHVNGRGYATLPTIRALVPLFRERGYSFVRVSELVRECGLPA
jgi:peptidoglycan-N-acetylglucosamine deacetylase